MKTEDIKYKKLIEEIKAKVPVLNNPDNLTQSVLSKIGELPAKRNKIRILTISAWVSGIAAVFLFLFLIGESINNNRYRKIETTVSANSIIVNPRQQSDEIQNLLIDETKFEQIIKNKQKQKEKKEEFIISYLSKF